MLNLTFDEIEERVRALWAYYGALKDTCAQHREIIRWSNEIGRAGEAGETVRQKTARQETAECMLVLTAKLFAQYSSNLLQAMKRLEQLGVSAKFIMYYIDVLGFETRGWVTSYRPPE